MKWLLFMLFEKMSDRENLWKVRIAHYPYMTANEIYGEMRVRQRGRSKGETLYKHIRRIK